MQTFPYSTVISDLDGTLLMPDHQLGEFTIQTLQKLTAQGIQFLVATGRPYDDVRGIFQHTGLKDFFIITSNGAKVHNGAGEMVYANPLPNDVAYGLTNLAFDESKVCVNTYEENGWFINVDVPSVADFHKMSGFTYRVANFAQHTFHGVEKVFFLADDAEALNPIEERVASQFGDKVKYTYSAPWCLEIMNKGVSKADTLAQIVGEKALKNALAFGDGLNDVEMLTEVKTGLIMGNADPRLVAVCPTLTQIATNAEQAVAHYLAELM